MHQVTLTPIGAAEFDVFLARSIAEYAQDKVKAGAWTEEEALERSAESYPGYFPEGAATPNQHVYRILAEDKSSDVGCVWISLSDAPAGKQAFVYEFFIDESCRNQGYGQAAMRALDDTARSLGAVSIGLHVFGHNTTALHVYRKAGYEVTDYKMAKRL